MSRAVLFSMALLMLAGCGIRRPLIPPSDIPAYEESLRRKRARLEQEQEAIDKANAPATVEAPAAPGTGQ